MDKNCYQVVRENWSQIVSNRVLWIFGFLAIVHSLYPSSVTRTEYIVLRCIGFIGSLIARAISAIGQVGLINIADDIVKGISLTFEEVWKRSLGYVIRVIVLDFVIGFLLVIPVLCYLFSSGPDSYQNPLYSFVFWLLSVFAFMIGTPSACAIVLDGHGIADSLKIGVKIFFRRSRDMFTLGIMFVVLPMFMVIFSFFLLDAFGYDVTLPSPLSISIHSYFEMTRVMPIAVISSVLHFLIRPLWVILITQLYKDQIVEINLTS